MQGHPNLKEILQNVWTQSEKSILRTEAYRYMASLSPGTVAMLEDMALFVHRSISDRTLGAVKKMLQDLGLWVPVNRRRNKRKTRGGRRRSSNNGGQRRQAASMEVDPLKEPGFRPGEAVIGYIKVIKCPCGRIHEVK